MHYSEIAGFVVVLAIFVVFTRLLLAVKGTISWSWSGESGSMLVSGFLSKGSRLRRTALLGTIVNQVSVAMRVNLPLAPTLRTLSSSRAEPVLLRRAQRRMAAVLEGGGSLSDAFLQVRGCPPLLVSILREGEACGQAPRAVSNIEDMLRDRLDATGGNGEGAGAYLGILLVSGFSILAGVMYYVIPKYREIFADFDAELPPMTISLINSYDSILEPFVFLFSGLVVSCFLLAAFVTVENRHGGPGLPAKIVSTVRSLIPFSRRLDFGFGMASAIRTLSARVRAGVPLERCTELERSVHPTNFIRGSLRRFSESVSRGTLPHKAASSAGLGKVFVSVLRMIERGEPALGPLDRAADYYQSLAWRWSRLLAAMAVPVSTLLFACVVGYVVLALFLPLVHLTDNVLESIL